MNWAIVVAGGNGKRIKSKVNKVFLPLLGKPLVCHTLQTLHQLKSIDQIIITIRLQDQKTWQDLEKKFSFSKIIKLMPAVATRQSSTWKVLKWLKSKAQKDDLIAVHNAVNPLVTADEINTVLSAAQKFGAALLATPAKDTVKISQDHVVSQTPLRQFVWYAQTPQVGRFDLMFKAFKKAHQENFIGTDDSQLLEKSGCCVKIVPCSPENFKITYPHDLILAEKILQERRQKSDRKSTRRNPTGP